MKRVRSFKALLEYLGGSRDQLPEEAAPLFASAWFRGIWWTLLIVLILFFSGQKSKFIYIDF